MEMNKHFIYTAAGQYPVETYQSVLLSFDMENLKIVLQHDQVVPMNEWQMVIHNTLLGAFKRKRGIFMKKRRNRFMALGLAAVLGLTAAGCQSTQESPKTDTTAATESKGQEEQAATEDRQEDKQVEETEQSEKVLSIWLATYISDEDKKKPQEEWPITQICNEFEKENPGVKVEITLLPDQGAAHQSYKAAALAKSGPDIVNLWSGQPIFALKDVVLDISDMIPPEDKENLIGWDVVTEDFKEGGKILGYPAAGTEICGFIYNTDLIKKAGVDLEGNPPKTVDEFMAMLQQIKDAGILPIIADSAGVNSLFTMNMATWWVQKTSNEDIAAESKGEKKFSEDENFKNAFLKAQEMFDQGYVNEDYASSQDALSRFLKGDAAMLGGVTSGILQVVRESLGNEKVGFYILPDYDETVIKSNTAIGGSGQVLAVANYCPNPELAVKFCSFLSNKENHLKLLKNYPMLPLRKDITLKDLGWEGDSVMEKVYNIAQNYSYWTDNSMVPDIANECFSLGTLAVTGKMTPDELAQKLDEKVQELQ